MVILDFSFFRNYWIFQANVIIKASLLLKHWDIFLENKLRISINFFIIRIINISALGYFIFVWNLGNWLKFFIDLTIFWQVKNTFVLTSEKTYLCLILRLCLYLRIFMNLLLKPIPLIFFKNSFRRSVSKEKLGVRLRPTFFNVLWK